MVLISFNSILEYLEPYIGAIILGYLKVSQFMSHSEYTISDKDYLELWKFFSEDVAKIKDKLWTIASWLYALMSALIAFIVKYILDVDIDQIPELILIIIFTGLLLSLYTVFMIYEYGLHIRCGWNRTNYIRNKIQGLDAIWDSGQDSERTWAEILLYGLDSGTGLPPFVWPLIWLALGYGLSFFGFFILIITK